MKKRVFVTDLDNVLLNMEEAWIAWVKGKFGVEVGEEDFRGWRIGDNLGLSPKDNNDLWAFVAPLSLRPYEGAVEFLKELRKEGVEPIIVTARSRPESQLAARKDVEALFSGTELRFSDHKYQEVGKMKAEGLEVWGFLDDKPVTAYEVAHHHTDFPTMLWDKPWNRGRDLSRTVTRVNNYEAVVDVMMTASLGRDDDAAWAV